MPQATNLTVKNAAGVDKTFTLLTPAPGYGTPAEWALKEGATSVVYKTFTLSAAKSSSQKTRRVTVKTRVPASYTSITTGLPVVSSTVDFTGTFILPDDFPDDQKDDAVAYATNVLTTALVKSCLRDGLPAN